MSMGPIYRVTTSWATFCWAAVGLFIAGGLIGCEGRISSQHGGENVDAAATDPDGPTGDGGRLDAGGAGGEDAAGEDAGNEEPELPEVGEVNPNTLDQDRLFACEDPAASASPARIRRLTPAQYNVRFVPRQGAIPYGSDERFRYTSTASDARMDDASAEQLLLYGFLVGEKAASRRISWGYCMRKSTYEPARDRPTRECLEEWAATYLKRAWQREATDEEVTRLVDYAWESIDEFGDEKGLALTAARPLLAPEFLYKEQLGQGDPDSSGRMQMGSWEVARAIAAAVTDMALVRFYHTRDVDEHLFEPLDALRAAAENNELQTREQVEAHIRALLDVPLPIEGEPAYPVLPTNIERFFQEYLGHPNAPFVFKNGGLLPREAPYIYYLSGAFPRSMDRTIAFLYQDDEQMLRRLLTTRDYFVHYGRDENGWAYNLADGDRDTVEPANPGMTTFPAEERAGMLTHPGWLIAHSRNQHTEPHPVHRGKWVYENMLCNALPQLPITVDAKLPDLPSVGVTERLRSATGPDAEGGYCWSCHKSMDPLGIPFEEYTHYGRYRTEEQTADGTMVAVAPAATLVNTGDPVLDGQQVAGATELVELLATSERVEGCFVRNVFRYFMRRNETYADACTLTQMREAYRDSDGSFQEMLVALVTSDAFLYRRPIDEVQP
jgi:hypothetical protein